MAAKLALAVVVGSVLFALAGELREALVLIPGLVTERFFLWQPLSYAFVATDPLGVIFGALIIVSIGGALEQTWGGKRLLLVALGTTVAAGFLTVALSLLFAGLRVLPFGGATVMTGVLWIAYGLSYGRQQMNFWGIPLTGNVFALIGVGFTFLQGAFGGFAHVIPEFIALGLVAAYVKLGTTGTLMLRVKTWRLQQQMRSRAKHLRVVSSDRNTPKDSDRYLH